MINQSVNDERELKTFVFEKEDTQQSLIVDSKVEYLEDTVNIETLLDQYCSLDAHRVSIYDPHTSKFTSLDRITTENRYLPKFYFEPSIILIRFAEKGSIINDSQSANSPLSPDNGSADQIDSRSRERTIGEAIEVVKKWRDLHLHGQTNGKKRLNLQEAAKLVGISKKSLDDYYCQLRLGQLYHFDYLGCLHEKMGVLRSYVKNYRPEKKQKIRRQNDKHPKNLKIIHYFDIETHSLKNIQELMKEEEYAGRNSDSPPQVEDESQLEGEPQQNFNEEKMVDDFPEPFDCFQMEDSPASKELFNLQHQFFKGFQIPLSQLDPYYLIERDLRKRDYSFDSNSFLFFD